MGVCCYSRRRKGGLRLRLALTLRPRGLWSSSGLGGRRRASGRRRRRGARLRGERHGRPRAGRRHPLRWHLRGRGAASPASQGPPWASRARHGQPTGRRSQVYALARSQPLGGHRFSEQPQQHNQSQCRGVPAASLLHGRPEQAEDAQPRRHTAAGAAAGFRESGCVQERVRRS